MGNPGFEKLLADNAEAQTLIEPGRLDLGTEHLLLEAAFLGLADHRLHQRVTDLQSAPVLEDRDPADMAVRQQPGGADREVPLEGQEMRGAAVIGVPLQLRRNRLLGNEHRLTNAPNLGVILLPVRDTYVNSIHRQIPGFLV